MLRSFLPPMTRSIPIAAALMLCACSPDPAPPQPDNATVAELANEATLPANAVAANQAAPEVSATTLTLDGLGALKIGEPVPAGSGWAERGAQASDTCRILSNPALPGTYAIVEEGRVRRVSVGKGASGVQLIEGAKVGSSEADVLAAFPGFRSEPHKYVEAPAKYLTAPGAEKGGPALRFEIDADRKVSQMHVGTMPVLGYVEACS